MKTPRPAALPPRHVDAPPGVPLAPCALCGAPAAPPGCRRCARVVAAGEGVL